MDPPASPHESLNAGNYNDGNSYTVLEQVAFARFVVDSLTANSIPFVVNEGGSFMITKLPDGLTACSRSSMDLCARDNVSDADRQDKGAKI